MPALPCFAASDFVVGKFFEVGVGKRGERRGESNGEASERRREERRGEKKKKKKKVSRLTNDRLAVRLHPGPDQDPSRCDDEVGDDSRGLCKGVFF